MWGGILGGIAGGLLGNATSGGTKNYQPTYQPKYQSQADTQLWEGLQRQAGIAKEASDATNPFAYQQLGTFKGLNPQAYLESAGQAAGLHDLASKAYGDAGNSYGYSGQALGNTVGSTIGGANAILNMGFDPRGQIYNRGLSNLTRQSNYGQAIRGLGTSGYGQGIYNKALTDYELDWQNQQLQRAISALGGASAGYQSAASQGSSAGNLLEKQASSYGNAADTAMKRGATEYEAQQGVARNNLTNIGQFIQLMQALQQLNSDANLGAQNYLNTGINATNSANSAINAQNARAASSTSGLGMLGALIGGKLFG